MNNGKPALALSNTDLTSTLYEAPAAGVVDDGTDGSTNTIQFPYSMQYRFLNLSDVPYVTFTKDGDLLSSFASGNQANVLQIDTLAYPQAFTNLQPGLPVTVNPFVVYAGLTPPFDLTIRGQTYVVGFKANPLALQNPYPVRAYASQPAEGVYAGLVPGKVLGAVNSLSPADISPNTQIYPNGIPAPENGYYTVALIGSMAGAAGSGQAKLIVVKHNQ